MGKYVNWELQVHHITIHLSVDLVPGNQYIYIYLIYDRKLRRGKEKL